MLNKIVAKRIRDFRHQKLVTQSQLARLVGVSQAEISRIENCSTYITLPDVEKISKALGVEVEDLLRKTA